MTSIDNMRAELDLWRRSTSDRELQILLTEALRRGPGSEAWNHAAIGLGLRGLRSDFAPAATVNYRRKIRPTIPTKPAIDGVEATLIAATIGIVAGVVAAVLAFSWWVS